MKPFLKMSNLNPKVIIKTNIIVLEETISSEHLWIKFMESRTY